MRRESVFSNLIWRFFERVGAQGVTFIVSIILARLLDPETYGMIAMVTIFTSRSEERRVGKECRL